MAEEHTPHRVPGGRTWLLEDGKWRKLDDTTDDPFRDEGEDEDTDVYLRRLGYDLNFSWTDPPLTRNDGSVAQGAEAVAVWEAREGAGVMWPFLVFIGISANYSHTVVVSTLPDLLAVLSLMAPIVEASRRQFDYDQADNMS